MDCRGFDFCFDDQLSRDGLVLGYLFGYRTFGYLGISLGSYLGAEITNPSVLLGALVDGDMGDAASVITRLALLTSLLTALLLTLAAALSRMTASPIPVRAQV